MYSQKSQSTQAQVNRIRTRLEEMRAYKAILAEQGEKPDADDKRIESELIVKLLRLEKGLPATSPAKIKGRSPQNRRNAAKKRKKAKAKAEAEKS